MNRRTKKDSRQNREKGGGWRRLFLFLGVLILGGITGGFLAFAHHVDRLDAPQKLPETDAIVVWTGPGAGRLEMAGQLLKKGRGERLLVSGVNPQLSADRVAELVNLEEDLASCCLDIDYAALDTRGNARETAIWAEAMGYEHILLVTSSYHMPRARLEISHESPGLKITIVPVRRQEDTDWWRDRDRFQRLLAEYGKYLLALARGRSEQDALREPALPEDALKEVSEDQDS